MNAGTNIKNRLPSCHVTAGPSCAPQAYAAVVAASRDASNAAPHPSGIATDQRSIKFNLVEAAEILAGEIFKKTPYAAGLQPGGRDVAKDIQEIGSISLLMKTLLDNGHLRGNCLTASGRTIAENLKSVKVMAVTGVVVGPKDNFAQEGAVVKVAGMSKPKFSGSEFPGSVRGLDREEAAAASLNVKLTGADAPEHETKRQSRATNFKSAALWKDAQRIGQAMGGAVSHPDGAHEKQCYADI
ncbi:dihydroxy-acid dehydratase [Bradyrhizobium sp. AUGA SZCCT0240]|uniref:dihydroxy-acid dehydratase domain-containing protein n=1 Tax=unclassified Bradyrhizobium TaxID=2631580 RepID=UPI001BADBA1E|nr:MULTISPECIES: dihydroxy-acid dehydratase [unclassified Bradyrhizobium]MBR1200901.1 dihydroxy-acid dehydratase [Bradyrhizobium sp. AUGA SZCCT0158]MBR1243380.1 dihydroxy-acid dehydratase [Bradyrhizobium sp. AUGA SZCCT0274]MBR1254869.1 dihydroxy-acid dehydratase [Bradyrhizobium sp. AUGA SZCCT0240]